MCIELGYYHKHKDNKGILIWSKSETTKINHYAELGWTLIELDEYLNLINVLLRFSCA